MSSGLFGRERIIHGHGLYIRLSVAERVRAARGMKQAIVKVRSFAHGAKAISKLMDYINRNGQLPLETESGACINGREEIRELVREWAVDFDQRADSRDSAHIIFSMPPGSNPDALQRSIRTVGTKAFPNREWVFAIHQDKNHPHAHMVVKMRGRDQGLKLDFKKADLHELRSLFAEAAREEGVPLAASPRAARGIGHKGQCQAIYQMRHKGIIPNMQKQTARELLIELDHGPLREKPWEKAMRERNDLERKEYLEEAEKLRKEAATEKALYNRELQKELLTASADLERFARVMPRPLSRRQTMVEKARIKPPHISINRDAEHDIDF